MTALFLVLMIATGAPGQTWFGHYERGVRLIEQGKAGAALPELNAALAMRGSEGLQIPTGSQQYIDYMPHLYLTIASQMAGDVEAARRHLQKAEDSGVAARSEFGRPLLIAYQLLLRGGASAKYPRPPFATYSDKPPLLSEEDFNLLRNDVLTKCNLPLDTRMDDAPWYANYELGLELERKGDYPRALKHFIDAVARRPNPQRQARMYGMWLIDYYPYLHIARSHVRLENWQCAKNALEISRKIGEIPIGAPEVTELMTLELVTERKLSQR